MIYGLINCGTCRKAVKAVIESGRMVRFVDFREHGISSEDLRKFLAVFGDKLVNRRSTTWRNLSEAERSDDPLTLLAAHPALMKRPVIDFGGRLYLGWGKDVQNAILC